MSGPRARAPARIRFAGAGTGKRARRLTAAPRLRLRSATGRATARPPGGFPRLRNAFARCARLRHRKLARPGLGAGPGPRAAKENPWPAEGLKVRTPPAPIRPAERLKVRPPPAPIRPQEQKKNKAKVCGAAPRPTRLPSGRRHEQEALRRFRFAPRSAPVKDEPWRAKENPLPPAEPTEERATRPPELREDGQWSTAACPPVDCLKGTAATRLQPNYLEKGEMSCQRKKPNKKTVKNFLQTGTPRDGSQRRAVEGQLQEIAVQPRKKGTRF